MVAVDRDAARLQELGYDQELKRGLRLFDNVAMGFAAISPVVGLYAVVLVGTVVAGPAWIWVLPVALAGQCLLLAVYSELASEFPISNGAYQWTRRLASGPYAWFNGWVAIWAYAVANTFPGCTGRGAVASGVVVDQEEVRHVAASVRLPGRWIIQGVP
jgi:hypothetical protein